MEETQEALAHIIQRRRSSPRKVRILGIVFVSVLLSLIFSALVLFSFGQNIPAICCLGGFAGIIVCSGFIVAIKQLIARRGNASPVERIEAVVLSCGFADGTDALFEIKLMSGEKQYVAYSNIRYEKGENVTLLKSENQVRIIENFIRFGGKQ